MLSMNVIGKALILSKVYFTKKPPMAEQSVVGVNKYILISIQGIPMLITVCTEL